jgi:hypothetical protein
MWEPHSAAAKAVLLIPSVNFVVGPHGFEKNGR